VLPFPFHFWTTTRDEREAEALRVADFYDTSSVSPVHFSGRPSCGASAPRAPPFRAGERGTRVSSEGFGRIRYHTELRRRLDTDAHLRRYFDQETTEIPEFYVERVRQDLARWQWLRRERCTTTTTLSQSEEPQQLEPVSVS